MKDMGSKKYDDIIKQKLSSLENKHRTPNWEKFNNMLDEVNEKDLEFDLKINQKLSKLSEKIYVRPQWNKLYHIIAERAARRKKVLRTKCMEMAVFFLILFSGYNLSNIIENEQKKNTDTEQLQYALNQPQENTSEYNSNIASFSSKSVEQNATSTESKIKSAVLKENKKEVKISSEHEKLVFAEAADTRESLITSTKQIDYPLQAITSNTRINSEYREMYENGDGNNFKENQVAFQEIDRELESIQSLDSPNLDALAVNNSMQDFSLPQSIHFDGENKFWKKIQIGAFLSNKFNYITIPERRNLFFDRKQEFVNTTINGGASLEYQNNNNIAFSVGLEYTKIKYNLKLSALEGTFLTNYERTTLNSIDYDFISLPIDVKYFVYQDNKWKISFLTGLGLDILGTSEYKLEVASNQSSKIVAPNRLSSTSQFATLNYQTGVLDSDKRAIEFNSSNKIIDNLYTKVRVGLGAQKQITQSVGIFSDFIYQYQINKEKGVGPNFDLIDSYTINVGLKYRLG